MRLKIVQYFFDLIVVTSRKIKAHYVRILLLVRKTSLSDVYVVVVL